MAVITKDISEPSFYTYANSVDVGYVCPPNLAGMGAGITCEPRNVVGQVSTSSYGSRVPGFEGGQTPSGEQSVPALTRWMGFNSTDLSVKVVEWGGYFPVVGTYSSKSGKIYGLPVGRFSRIAFLADLTEGSAQNDLNHDRDEMEVTVGLNTHWLARPNTDPLTRATCGVDDFRVSERRTVTKVIRVQNEDQAALGTALNPLPEYLKLRGATLGLSAYDWRLNAQNGYLKNGLYATIAYNGEFDGSLRFTSDASANAAVQSLLPRTSVLQRFDVFQDLPPLPVYALHFDA